MCYVWVLMGRHNCVAACACSEFVLWNTSKLDRCQTLGEQLQRSWYWKLWPIHVIILTQNLSLGLSHCVSEYSYWLHAVFRADSWMERAIIFSWQEEIGIAGESTSQWTFVAAGRINTGCCGCPGSANYNWGEHGCWMRWTRPTRLLPKGDMICPGTWCNSCRVRFASIRMVASWKTWEEF